MARVDATFRRQISNLARDYPGFTGTGASQDQQRTVQVFGGFALLRVQARKHAGHGYPKCKNQKETARIKRAVSGQTES
jgi:hypothetical protein